jgi:hyperosmotically inducible periplasmic protein
MREGKMNKTNLDRLSILAALLLAASLSACNTVSKTAEDAPAATNRAGEAPTQSETKTQQDDARDPIRKRQLEADIRAREQRNKLVGNQQERDSDDLESEVRSKLEANIPKSRLTVEAEDATVTVSGSVTSQDQLQKIEPLARQIKGVQNVVVKAVVSSGRS